MKLTHLRPNDYRTMPWKNGLGSTTEIAIYPRGTSLAAGDFVWRLSSAVVRSDGPFSPFKGFTRQLAILDGPGILLTVDGRESVVDGDRVVSFSGDATTSARLRGGAVTDLNLIVHLSRAASAMRFFRASSEELKIERGTGLVISLSGATRVEFSNHPPLTLAEFETLIMECEFARLRLHPESGARAAFAVIGS